MTANFQPSPADVQMFMSLVGLDYQEAVRRLKGNNNNVEQAVNEYFEDPKSSGNSEPKKQDNWDEDAFSSDRNGARNGHGIAFAIQGADDLGPSINGRFDGTLSRAPSRTDNKSPLNKIIDLTAEHALADPSMSMSSQDYQDRELQQALALSLQDAGLPPQEDGVTGIDEPHFGPANRNEYEKGQWEMVPIGKSSIREIIADPEPLQRKRDLDVPPFLKPTLGNNRLNALITIYHEIPLIRNIFLNTTDVLPSYGHDKEWWAGQRIVVPMVQSDDEPPPYGEIDRELQRLMAFLDKTERSYGSVDVLTHLQEVERVMRRGGGDVESAVLSAWKNVFHASNHGNATRAIFSTGVASEAPEEQPHDFAILELALPAKESVYETLYDIADDVLWPGYRIMDVSATPYLSHIAEVLVFKIEGGAEHKRVEIPAVLYPDRYSKTLRLEALEMRKQKKVAAEKLERIVKLEGQLTHYPLRGKLITVKELFNASLKHDENTIQENGVQDEREVDEPTRPSAAAMKLSDELRKVLESIDKKLSELGKAKEEALQELRALSKLYTEPTEDPFEPKLTKYLLRGVSTTRHTMYLCRRAEPDLIDMVVDGEDEGGAKGDGDQWWKIHYAPAGTNPVHIEKTTLEKVLDAAKNESNNTILVYASEHASNAQRHNLPKPLENFVSWDNAAFRSELPGAEDDNQSIGWGAADDWTESSTSQSQTQTSPSSPAKRKYEAAVDGSVERVPSVRRGSAASGTGAGQGQSTGVESGMGQGNETRQLRVVNVTEWEVRSDESSSSSGESALTKPSVGGIAGLGVGLGSSGSGRGSSGDGGAGPSAAEGIGGVLSNIDEEPEEGAMILDGRGRGSGSTASNGIGEVEVIMGFDPSEAEELGGGAGNGALDHGLGFVHRTNASAPAPMTNTQSQDQDQLIDISIPDQSHDRPAAIREHGNPNGNGDVDREMEMQERSGNIIMGISQAKQTGGGNTKGGVGLTIDSMDMHVDSDADGEVDGHGGEADGEGDVDMDRMGVGIIDRKGKGIENRGRATQSENENRNGNGTLDGGIRGRRLGG